MKTIKSNDFFRMSFILQDNSASTTSNYLAKIILYVLYEKGEPLNIEDIQQLVYEKFALEFTVDEIQNALEKVTKRDKDIVTAAENRFVLSPQCANRLSKESSVEDELHHYVKKAKSEFNISLDDDDYYNLITRYLYYCFNANREMLLSLINGESIKETIIDFKATNEEISAINKFVLWENEEKNALIYRVVSYCYVYCSLNTKKDILLSKQVFKSKRFFLDANIIFRLAGINNDDRQETIKSFEKKCNELGIRLCYTDSTYDELLRVIDQAVKWLKSINNNTMPLDLRNYDVEQNDIYNMYVDWCKSPLNSYREIVDFRTHLLSLINSTIANMEYIKTTCNYVEDKLEADIASLKSIKDKNPFHKKHSHIALLTDVKNVHYVDYVRNKNANKGSIFSTNDYFITADHNLIQWAQNNYSGVPITVLPSIWLTIMLRFTGRSSDDYKAFCLFMSLRMHKDKESLDVYSIIKELNYHTSDQDLKERIIAEIVTNKDEYKLEDTNESEVCEKIVVKAFESIISENNAQKDLEFESIIKDKEAIKEREKQEAIELERTLEKQSNVEKAAKAETDSIMKKRRSIKKTVSVIGLCLEIVAIVSFLLYVFGVEPVYTILSSIIPERYQGENDFELLSIIGGAVLVLANIVNLPLNKICSQEAESKLLIKKQNKYNQIFNPKD